MDRGLGCYAGCCHANLAVELTANNWKGASVEQYTISSEHASVIAIDQHARSVTMSGIDFPSGEERCGRLADCPSAADIAAWAEP